MIDPTPGQDFEFAGLTWRFEPANFWFTSVGANKRVGIRKRIDGVWRSVWDPENIMHDTAESACRWALRTCPGAKCASCRNFEAVGGACLATYDRWKEPTSVPADGYCHEWSARGG
jgi:hypothetical protein